LSFVDPGVRRTTAGCFTANEASWRLMERVGMRREAHARAESLHRDEEWMDTYVHAMLREDWAART
jgi:RimJ/RimL family protein N-acetyltransferase